MPSILRLRKSNGTLELTLDNGDMFTIRRPTNVKVTRGRAWITVEGSLEDNFIDAGQQFTSPRGRRTVVQADPQCTVELVPH